MTREDNALAQNLKVLRAIVSTKKALKRRVTPRDEKFVFMCRHHGKCQNSAVLTILVSFRMIPDKQAISLM